MSSIITCSRCGEERPALERKPPLPGDDADRILDSVCAECWQEWREEEVRTINELRLNFMDPEAQRVLRERMFRYLGLDEGQGTDDGGAEPLCERN